MVTDSFFKSEFPKIDRLNRNDFVLVDIGTTTIAMELYNGLGEKKDEYVCPNPQRVFGADVISRILAAENPMNLLQMQSLVKNVLIKGIQEFEKSTNAIEKIYIAGNTTMLYLLNGHNPAPLGYAPFQADFLHREELTIAEVPAITLPGLSAFVGADVVAGILACSMDSSDKISLLIDLGTNGELVLGNGKRMLACSTAAGPVFDGLCSKDGKAVWGADIIALIAGLIEKGLVDETGLLAEPYFTTGIDIGGVHVTQESIRQLQTAKAAIAAGIECLLQEYGLQDITQIEQVYLAGGMGYFLNETSAIQIGLLPQVLNGKVQAVGNTALAGAYHYSMEKDAEQKIVNILHKTEIRNLSDIRDFSEKFVNNMNLYKKQ